ncbi:MAG TPA: hypothetical protein VK987_03860 [Anaerolineae bacterium]|nr:hypothetical protein [Anaerolineae bacterium]
MTEERTEATSLDGEPPAPPKAPGTTGELTAEAPLPGPRRTSGRSILAALFWLLSCLAILAGGVTLWAHQTILTSDGWGTIVAGLASDEEVIAATSERLVDRVSESLAISDRVAQILPGEMSLLAGAITRSVQDRVTDRVAEIAATEPVQDAFIRANELAHEAAMTAIRGGDSEVLTSQEGTISLNVFPLIEGVLVGLQDAGLIDEGREIPDLSGFEPDPERVARLETILGRDLPDDIGTITLIESDRLDRVQTAVRAFDVITIALIALAIVCIALALWLSQRRLRMLLWLAIGSIVALLLGRGFTRLVIEDITGTLRDGENGPAVVAVVDSSVDSLLWFTFALIVVALIVAGIAILAERRAELAEAAAEPDSVREWLRSRSRAIGYIGIGLVAFVVVWNVGGTDITLLAGALLGIVLIVVSLLGGRGEGVPTAEQAES